MELASLRELYVEGLRDLYSAEHQILKALPKLHKGATNPKVKAAFATHLAQTEAQVVRLEEIFTELGLSVNVDAIVADGEMAASTDE